MKPFDGQVLDYPQVAMVSAGGKVLINVMLCEGIYHSHDSRCQLEFFIQQNQTRTCGLLIIKFMVSLG